MKHNVERVNKTDQYDAAEAMFGTRCDVMEATWVWTRATVSGTKDEIRRDIIAFSVGQSAYIGCHILEFQDKTYWC